MKYLGFFFIIAIISTVSNGELKTIESRELVNINGTLFYISAEEVTFTAKEGMIICNDIGFKLISIEAEEKQTLIAQYLLQNNYGTRSFWTSGVRYYNSMLLWSGTGRMFTYSNWDTNEPDLSYNTPDICVYLAGSGKWRDAECSEQHSVICEQINQVV